MSNHARWATWLLWAVVLALPHQAGAWQQTITTGAGDPQLDAAYDVTTLPGSRDVIAAGSVDFTFGNLFSVTRHERDHGDVQWFHIDQRGEARAVAATDALVAAAGTMNLPNSGNDFVVKGLHPEFGFELWEAVVEGQPACNDAAYAVAIDAAGDVYAAGTIGDVDFGQAWIVVKIDGVTGAELWRDQLPDGEALALAVLGGNVVAAGVVDGQFVVRSLDAGSGDEEWTSESGDGRAVTVAFDGEGTVYAAGEMTDSCGGEPCGIVRLVASTGQVLWRRTFIDPGLDVGAPTALVATPFAVFVAGWQRDAFDTFTVLRREADGSFGWLYTLVTDGTTRANDIALAAGSVVATGFYSDGEQYMAVARLDMNDGEEQWQQLIAGVNVVERNEGLAITVDAADDVVTSGVLVDFLQNPVYGVVKLEGDTGDDFDGPCGNGDLDAGEQCDDGNNQDFDCCSSTCTFEANGSFCDSDGNECTDDVCDGAGTCLHENNDDECDDDDDCTTDDVCSLGSCAGVQAPIGTECDTGNVCLSGACNADGTCVATANTDPCNDFNGCTTDDTCGNGTCQGTPVSGIGCDDFNPCTGTGVCQGGTCLPGPSEPAGTDCFSDGNECTDDVCNGSGACVHPFNSAPCDDGDVCTPGGVCNEGSCEIGGTTTTTTSSTTTTSTSSTSTTTSSVSTSTSVTSTTSTSATSTTSTSVTTTTSSSSTTTSSTTTSSTSSTSSSSTTSTSSTTTSTVQACSVDGTCDDGNVCNGEESCQNGGCAPPSEAVCLRGDAEAWVTSFRGDAVAVIDVGTRAVEATITVAGAPWGVVWHPDGGRVYVTSRRGGTVTAIDTATRTVVATATVGREPLGIAIDPSGARLWVANHGSETVSVLDADTLAPLATVRTGRGPAGIAVHPAGTRVYVSNYRARSVSIIDATTTSVVDTVAVDELPLGIAVHPAGTKVYVTSYRARNVNVIGTTSATVLGTIRVGRKPVGVAFDASGGRAFVASSGDDVLAIVDTAADRVLDKVAVGDLPLGVAVDLARGQPWVTGADSDAVSIVGDAVDAVPLPRTPVAFGAFIGRPAGRCPQPAPRCDDADPFTRDGCAATAGCQHEQLLGLEAVAAGVSALTDTVASAPLGDGPLAQRLRAEVPALGGVIAAVQSGGDRAAGRLAKRRLTQVVRLLERARRRGELGPDGGRLLDLARETRRRLKAAL